MTLTPPYEIRPVSADGMPEFMASLERAFGWDPSSGEVADTFDRFFSRHRMLASYDGETVAGTAGAIAFSMTVPGAQRPCAGVTTVSVTSTYRRQRVLTSLMRRQLDDIHEEGVEALAALWASEPQIYQRFGYGLASWRSRLSVDTPWSAYSPEAAATLGRFTGRLRLVTADEGRRGFAEVYDAAAGETPGMVSREPARWDVLLLDQREGRDGASERVHVLAETASGLPLGYAFYRLAPSMTPHGAPDGEVRLIELVAATTEAHAALWRHLFDLALFRRVTARTQPSPDPLLLLLADPRHAQTAVTDALWLRLVDLPRALAERLYSGPSALTLRVHDRFLPWNDGVWRVEIDELGSATVESAPAASPDLELSAVELGAAHLGAQSLAGLAAAGRVVEHAKGALVNATRAWSWHVPPHTPDIF